MTYSKLLHQAARATRVRITRSHIPGIVLKFPAVQTFIVQRMMEEKLRVFNLISSPVLPKQGQFLGSQNLLWRINPKGFSCTEQNMMLLPVAHHLSSDFVFTWPTIPPTSYPTNKITKKPSQAPSQAPSSSPTSTPTSLSPTQSPSSAPTKLPTQSPSRAPTQSPTKLPKCGCLGHRIFATHPTVKHGIVCSVYDSGS